MTKFCKQRLSARQLFWYMFCCMTYYCNYCELATGLSEPVKDSRYRSSDQFFVRLGELSTHGHRAITSHLKQALQRCPDPMGRFEEDHRPAHCDEPLKPPSVF